MNWNTVLKLMILFIMSFDAYADFKESEALAAMLVTYPNSTVEIKTFKETTGFVDRKLNVKTYEVKVLVENDQFLETITYTVTDGRSSEKGRVVYNIKRRKKQIKKQETEEEKLVNIAMMNFLKRLNQEILILRSELENNCCTKTEIEGLPSNGEIENLSNSFSKNNDDELQLKEKLFNYGKAKIKDLKYSDEELELSAEQSKEICSLVKQSHENLIHGMDNLLSYTQGQRKIAKSGMFNVQKSWEHYYKLKAQYDAVLAEQYIFSGSFVKFVCK